MVPAQDTLSKSHLLTGVDLYQLHPDGRPEEERNGRGAARTESHARAPAPTGEPAVRRPHRHKKPRSRRSRTKRRRRRPRWRRVQPLKRPSKRPDRRTRQRPKRELRKPHRLRRPPPTRSRGRPQPLRRNTLKLPRRSALPRMLNARKRRPLKRRRPGGRRREGTSRGEAARGCSGTGQGGASGARPESRGAPCDERWRSSCYGSDQGFKGEARGQEGPPGQPTAVTVFLRCEPFTPLSILPCVQRSPEGVHKRRSWP